MTDYARFIQSPLFAYSTQLINNSWFQINPFFRPNWENIPFFSEDIKNGLNRQY